MAFWQQWFYNPFLASASMKHKAQWKTMTTNMTTEMKTETRTKILLPDQDPMVRSSIWSRCLGITEEDWATTVMAIRPRHSIYLLVSLYIYLINTILKCTINYCLQKLVFWACAAETWGEIPVELIIKETTYISLYLSNQPPVSPTLIKIGWWCSNPGA